VALAVSIQQRLYGDRNPRRSAKPMSDPCIPVLPVVEERQSAQFAYPDVQCSNRAGLLERQPDPFGLYGRRRLVTRRACAKGVSISSTAGVVNLRSARRNVPNERQKRGSTCNVHAARNQNHCDPVTCSRPFAENGNGQDRGYRGS